MIIEVISEGDFEEINELLERNGLTSIDYKSALYNKYPSSKSINFPIGWKLKDLKGKIRGVLFSHITECEIKNKKLFACIMLNFF